VLAHWQTEKPAFRLELTGGTSLVASGDHRFLTSRGWRQVSVLAPGDRLTGMGGFDESDDDSPLRVDAVHPLHTVLPMYDITTGTGDFIANGVVSHNCFARPTHEYLGLDIGADFERKIVVKINAVERLRVELNDPGWTHEGVAMGTNTDPYQRCEGKYKLTRGVVQALTEHANPFSILTKSALVLRDLDLISEAARRTDVSVNFSVGTLDERVWRATEPGTPHPRRRIEAMRQLAEAGVRTGALIAPVLPGLSDSPEQLGDVSSAIRAAGGQVMGTVPLHLRPGVREHFLGWLAGYDPRLHADYLRRYAKGSYAPEHYAEHIRRLVAEPNQPAGARSPTGPW
jgi:DNA repair photolyase